MAAEGRRQSEARAFREIVSSGNAGFGGAPGSSASFSGAAAASVAGGHVMQELSLAKANMYKPPQTILFHEPSKCRIRCYVGPSRSGRGCNLQPGLPSVGMDQAIWVVLTQAWALHTRAHPNEPCPWDFSDLKISDDQ